MEGPNPAKLTLWAGWTRNAVDTLGLPAEVSAPHRPAILRSRADEHYASEALRSRWISNQDLGTEPYTLQWFQSIETQRYGRQGKWIPRLLEFAKHSGETLLGLGMGLGTDWLQYALHGASVVVCSPSAEHLELTRRNFEVRGLPGRFLHSPGTRLPFDGSSIDVICMSSPFQDGSDPQQVVGEIYRVLKPGGKVLAIVPARYDVDFWFALCFPLTRIFGRRQPVTTDAAHKYSRKDLRHLFADFIEHRIHKRHLTRSDIPHIWRWALAPSLSGLWAECWCSRRSSQ